MFRRNKADAAAPIPVDRIKSIAAQTPPADYADLGGRGGRAKRQPVFKQGLAILPHGEKLPIAIKSLSATGLRIEFFQNRQLPETMTITEPSVPLHFDAEVIWQDDGVAGLKIVPGSAADRDS